MSRVPRRTPRTDPAQPDLTLFAIGCALVFTAVVLLFTVHGG